MKTPIFEVRDHNMILGGYATLEEAKAKLVFFRDMGYIPRILKVSYEEVEII